MLFKRHSITMKLLWTLGALFAFLLTINSGSGYIAPSIVRRCLNSTGVEVTELALFYATDFSIIMTPVKCYMGCLFETAGFVENGRLSEDLIYMAKNPEEMEQLQELVKSCDRSTTEGECEPNFQAFKCWILTKAVMGIK